MNNLLPHLIEFRRRLILCCSFIFVLFLILFWQDEKLYHLLAKPLLKLLPPDCKLIATEVTSAFMVPMKLAFITSLYLSMPYILFQVWSFVAPGLYRREKQTIFPLILGSIFLFYLGSLFSYFVICPLALEFFVQAAPEMVQIMTDIRHYQDFILTLILGGGLAFQVPVLVFALVQSKILSLEKLEHLRPYVIVLAFILGMVLTPPDVVSQILMALPMWWLYEIGLFGLKILEKRKTKIRVF